jgi:hypothetical protein
VKFSDGFEVAVAVKYQERVAKLKAQMNLLRKTASYSFDDIVILTENDVDQGDFRNALVVLLTREHHDQAEIEKLLGEIRGRTKFQFFEMYHKDVDRKKRFTAIWRLIDAGVLAPLQRGWINNVSWLKVTL